MEDSLVSIIMPVYNGEWCIRRSIDSILNQTYKNWELIIVNDGSLDNTANVVRTFDDKRIKYFESLENKGVSFARNIGLSNSSGSFIAFLDADDVYPPNSIKSRLNIFFQDDGLRFVDGCVEIMDSKLTRVISIWRPSFKGIVKPSLCRLDSRCFFGNTWMIRKDEKVVPFNESITHAEDLLFYIQNANSGKYSYTENVVLKYRRSNHSAMTNIVGLENGYNKVLEIVNRSNDVSITTKTYLKKRIKRILLRSYLKIMHLRAAFRVLIRIK